MGINVKLKEKIKNTLRLPKHQKARLVLLAMRCGYITGTFELTGFDNFLTRFLWRIYLYFHKIEKQNIINYLREVSQAFEYIKK